MSASYISPAYPNKDFDTNRLINLGSSLISRGIFGFVGVDLITFPDPFSSEGTNITWAIDLDLHMTDYISNTYFNQVILNNTVQQDDPDVSKYNTKYIQQSKNKD